PYQRDLRAKIGHTLLLQPGVAAVIVNAAGQVLLQRRSDDGEWGLPAGGLEPGEEPAEALVREVREETALEVVPERIVGVYGGPDFFVRYPNGDEAAILSITFACRPLAGEPRVNDDESLEVRYFALDALPVMAQRHRMRIDDALRNDPRARFR
ncbi:MAG TPA: NUDIX domain-containing protein, partial [Solirubrobacterales bacterium]|nr:NUDIX domain-containing protein [Solirubrobacterales bacterium]